MAAQAPAAPSMQERIVSYIKETGPLIEKAAAITLEHDKHQQKVAAAIPGVVEALIANGQIRPEQREKCASVLRDHAKTLDLLAKVAETVHSDPAERIGTPTGGTAQVKTASDAEHGDERGVYFVGSEPGMSKAATDELYKGLGLQPPVV